MEIVIFLLLLALLIIILPVLAMMKASNANRRADELASRIDPLEQEIYSLRRQISRFGKTHEAAASTAGSQETVAKPEPISPIKVVKDASKGDQDEAHVEPRIQKGSAKSAAVPPPLPVSGSTSLGERTRAGSGDAKEPARLGFALDRINWEQFMGVRLFAWLGGFALFLAAAFFVKYSFDHGLIPPVMRVTLGYVVGLGLLVGGIRMSQRRYKITADTLSATGIVILYAVTFACRSVYHFPAFQPVTTFVLMTLITGTAFLLSVRMNAMVVAILGMLGGFLTPILVSTGQDNPVGLFTYIALLDVGLIAVAFVRRWDWLTVAAASCTALMQLGWVVEFFDAGKVFIAMTVFLGFCGLFLGANFWSQRRARQNIWLDVATLIIPAGTFLFVPALIADGSIGERPGIIFTFLLGADLAVIGLAVSQVRLRFLNQLCGGIVFLLLVVWTMARLNDGLLFWALGGYLGFSVLHTVVPIYLQRRNPDQPLGNWAQAFPLLTLLMTLLPMLKIESASGVVWSFVLIVDLLAIALAVMVASMGAILVLMLVTIGLAFVWLINTPADVVGLPGMLTVLGGVTTVFTLAAIVGGRKILDRQNELGADKDRAFLPAGWTSVDLQKQIPSLSAILPFMLLLMVTAKLPIQNPAPIFGFALGLGALLLGLSRVYKLDWLPATGLGCSFLLEQSWHLQHFTKANAGLAVTWYLIFYAMYLVFPFLFQRNNTERVVSWGSAAMSGAVHFLLVLNLVQRAWPNEFMGIVPALFAIPAILGLVWLIGGIPSDDPKRNAVLAWFGGVSLFFITLIFPIQFDRQWLTISWALEGAALIWLFGRIPHQGLRYTGLVLLVVAFARLALNLSVLDYSPRSHVPVLNWYLYTYGLVAGSLFAGAGLLKVPNHTVFDRDVRPFLITMGTVLAFFLLNIEIADFFSEPGQPKLAFKFSGNFARDMSYTIGWALFAFILMLIGILKRVRASRWAAIGLLGATLIKLFFHDLAALNQLYRVGALVGVAVIAIVVSFLYQKFLSNQMQSEEAVADDRSG